MIDALAAPLDVALFENADWRVLADGLMHRETAYFIPREGLDRRRDADLWEWPLHCAEKRWCAPRPFREAFLAAAELFDLPRDEALAQSFAVGFGLRMGQGGTPATDGFLTLGDLVRPKPVLRKRTAGSEARSSARRGGPPAVAPQKEAGLGRVALS